MRTLKTSEAKARFNAFLAKVKASKEEARHCKNMEQPVPTTIRDQRVAGQEERA